MSSTMQWLLMKVSEEGTEVSQAACKGATFGLMDSPPKSLVTNAADMVYEINDVLATVELLCGELQAMGISTELFAKIGDREMIETKKKKVLRWAHRAAMNGVLNPSEHFQQLMDENPPTYEIIR